MFNPSFKRALDSDDDEPLGNKRAKITQPQNLSPQARQIHENNERGTELIRKMLVLEREKECAGGDLFTAKRYAVRFPLLNTSNQKRRSTDGNLI